MTANRPADNRSRVAATVVVSSLICGCISEDVVEQSGYSGDRNTTSTVAQDASSDALVQNEKVRTVESLVHTVDAVLRKINEHHSLEDGSFRVEVSPKSDSDWMVYVTFLPETPSAELAGYIERDGTVVVMPLY